MADANGITITILGSGTSTGVPVIGCDCPVCTSAERRNRRSRCSALLSWNGRNVLIDTSPDLRQQSLDNHISRIDAVLYTHGHADHVHGIDDLRMFNALSGENIPVYGSRPLIEQLARCFGYVFAPSNSKTFLPRLEPRVIDGPLDLFGRLVEPIDIIHGRRNVLGYRVGPLAYLTDCSAVPEHSWPLLQNLEVLVIDGLRFRAHATHFTVAQAVGVAQRLEAKRVVLTHLSHDVDYVRHSAELPDNVEYAYDGLTITL